MWVGIIAYPQAQWILYNLALLSLFMPVFNSRQKQTNPFEGWPGSPGGLSVFIPKPKKLVRLGGEASRLISQPNSSSSVFIIALGATGEAVLSELISQTRIDPGRSNIALITLGSSSIKFPNESEWNYKHLDLNAHLIMDIPLTWQVEREEAYYKFRHYTYYSEWIDFISHSFRQFNNQSITVLIVGSPAEAEIGVIEPLLQALHLSAPQRINLKVMGLFSLKALQPVHDQQEIYAVLRELGRFTYNGMHWAQHPQSTLEGEFNGVLIDHLFLVEDIPQPDTSWGFHLKQFKDGLLHELVEAVIGLSQTAYNYDMARGFLDQLQRQNNFHMQHSRPTIHSLGIASLYVPLSDIVGYITARLSLAVLFGESPNNGDDGLVGASSAKMSQRINGEDLIRRWLSSGPSSHPFFEWFLGISRLEQLRDLPPSTLDMFPAFRTQVCNGIVQLLSQMPAHQAFTQILAGLEWFNNHIQQIQNNLRVLGNPPQIREKIQAIDKFLEHSNQLTRSLISQVKEWQQTLQFDEGWQNSSNYTNKQRIDDVLQRKLAHIEERLALATHNLARKPIGFKDDGEVITPLRRYYETTIRPELSIPGSSQGLAFSRVRERLGWWIDAGLENPKLYLVCVPHDQSYEEGSALPADALFLPKHCETLVNQLSQICECQINMPAVTDWFLALADQNIDFLKISIGSLLRYDSDRAAKKFVPPVDEYFLLAPDAERARALIPLVFPNQLTRYAKPVGNFDPTRISAMSIRFNIPIDTVLTVNEAYASYSPPQESKHLCAQERLAVTYEKAMRSLMDLQMYDAIRNRVREFELIPPDLTMALVDDQLVTLFCQALFYGIITPVPNENGERYWYLSEQSSNFDQLYLAPADEKGMWKAFQKFVIELPNATDLVTTYTNPFHPARRAEFLRTLQSVLHKCSQSADALEQKKFFRQTHLASWKQKFGNDVFGFAFACLLEVELQNPVWPDWNR